MQLLSVGGQESKEANNVSEALDYLEGFSKQLICDVVVFIFLDLNLIIAVNSPSAIIIYQIFLRYTSSGYMST